MAKINELLPCPFCASKNVMIGDLLGNSGTHSVFCGNCGVRTPNCADEQDAIYTWNTRHTPKRELVTND